MDGLGNDFVIIDQRNQNINLSKSQIIKICDRNFIGCDQLILINNSTTVDASLEFFNSDGSLSGACGNGSRCVADLLSKQNNKKEIVLSTSSGILKSNILDNNLVETNIGIPKTNWEEIPLSENLNTKNLKIKILDKNNQEHIGGIAINVGNPHIIFFTDNLEIFELEIIGPKIENHKLFPEKCNVTIAKVVSENLIKVKVWERGAGITKACGSAACAIAVAAHKLNLSGRKVLVSFSGGDLKIVWKEDNDIVMTGPYEIEEAVEINLMEL